MKIKNVLFVLLSLLFGNSVFVFAQDFPEMQADIQSISVDLEPFFGTDSLHGKAVFVMRPKTDRTSRIIFTIHDLSIDSIRVSAGKSNNSQRGDTLIIQPEQPVSEEFTVSISYRSLVSSGIHRPKDSLWVASREPGAQAGWMPVVLHPAVHALVGLSAIVPKSLSFITAGQLIRETEVDQNRKRVEYKTANAIRLSDMSFVAGRFSSAFVTDQNRSVEVFAETSVKVPDSLHQVGKWTLEAFQTMETWAGQSFPISSVNLIILPDLYWESKTSSPGLMFLSPFSGAIKASAQLAVIRQVLGGLVLPADSVAALWIASGVSSAYKAVYNELPEAQVKPKWLDAEPEEIKGFNLSEAVLKRWMRERSEVKGETLLQWAWEADGLSHFGLQSAGKEPQKEFYLNAVWSDSAGKKSLLLELDSLSAPIDVTVAAILRRDTLRFPLKLDPMVYIELDMRSDVRNFFLESVPANFSVNYQKPDVFWISQVRNAVKFQEKREGLKALKKVRNNPDLQLFLHDLIRLEKNAQLRAECLNTLAFHLNGATGSSGLFLNEISSPDTATKRQAIAALKYYGVQPDHVSRLQAELRKPASFGIRREIIRSLSVAMDSAAWVRWNERQFTRLENVDLHVEMVNQSKLIFKPASFDALLMRWLGLKTAPFVNVLFVEKISNEKLLSETDFISGLKLSDVRLVYAWTKKASETQNDVLRAKMKAKEINRSRDRRVLKWLEIISDIPAQ